MITQYIPSIFEAVVEKVDEAIYRQYGFHVFFDYGHLVEVTKNLVIKGSSPTQKGERYPLVWLVMDFPEEHGKDPSIYAEVSLTIIIAMPTNNTYTMEKRRDEVFIPKLYPIYQELLMQISKSRVFGMPSVDRIEHVKVDRPYWGNEESGNSKANLFKDFIDAIEIRNLKLKIKQQQIC